MYVKQRGLQNRTDLSLSVRHVKLVCKEAHSLEAPEQQHYLFFKGLFVCQESICSAPFCVNMMVQKIFIGSHYLG